MADPNLFFSVLNELARTAKQAMPLAQWQKYLTPGRMLDRGGVKFPLRADEVKYGPLSQLAGQTSNPPTTSYTPAEMAGWLEQNQQMTPAFRELGPERYQKDNPNLRQLSMYYKDQYQLPGPKLGQAEELTVLPGSDFVPSTSHFGGQPGLVSWSRVTRRPVIPTTVDTGGSVYRVEHPLDYQEHAKTFTRYEDAVKYAEENYPEEMKDPSIRKELIKETTGKAQIGDPTATHLEEIQSDWHQRAREEGYNKAILAEPLSVEEQKRLVSYSRFGAMDNATPEQWQDYLNLVQKNESRNDPGIPHAPYKDTYPELELRKGIARALAQGDDYVTWTTGDQQADRWGQALRNSVDELHWTKKPDGTYDLIPYKNQHEAGIDERLQNLTPDQLHDTVGADIAKRITAGEGSGSLSKQETARLDYLNERHPASLNDYERSELARHQAKVAGNAGVVAGANLTVGGAGMRLFYDRKVKEAAERLARQYGGEVTRVKIPGQGTWNEHEVDYHFGSVAVPEREFNRNLDRARAALGNPDIEPDHPLAQLERAYHDYHEFAGGYSDYSEQQANEALRHYAEAKDELTRSFSNQPQEVHALRLTPQMKERVLKAGLPLFSAGALAGVGTGLYAGPGSAAEEPSPPMPEAPPPVPQHLAEGGLVRSLADLAGAAWRDLVTQEVHGPFAWHNDIVAPNFLRKSKLTAQNIEDMITNGHLQDGFLTQGGKFISREDAAQQLGYGPHTGNLDLAIGYGRRADWRPKYATGGLTNPLPGLPNPLEAYGYAGSRQPRHRPPRAALPNLHPGMPAEPAAPDYERLLGSLEGTGGAPPALRPVDYGGGEGNPGLSAAPPGAAGQAPATDVGGTPGGWRTALKTAEGGPQPGQPVAGSTALGPYRFTAGTWADVARAHPELGLTPDGRTNDAQADLAVTALWKDHAHALLALNEPPTDANLRTLHFLGQGDGLSFLYAATAAPGDPAVAHVSPRAAAANRAIFYDDKGQPRTVGQVYGLLSRGFGGSTFAGQYLTPDVGLPPPG